MIRNKHLLILLLTITALILSSGYASAQDKNPATISDNEVNEIAKQLYCPVCENIPLDVCGTQACIQWRELIREKLADGWSEKQIKDYFVLQYGDRVLAEPPRRGLNLLVYFVPPIAFLAGVYILFRGIKSWREIDKGKHQIPDQQEKTGLDDYISQLEKELQKSDK